MVLTQTSTLKVYDDDHFTELLNMTNSQFDEGLDSSALTVLLENLHENCLEADDLIEALSLDDPSTSDSFIQVSLVIAEFLMKDQCTGQGVQPSDIEDAAERFNVSSICRSDFFGAFEDMSNIGKIVRTEECSPSKLASLEEWDRVFDENCTTDMDDVHQAFATFFVVLIEKHCVLPRPEHFVEEIFRQYNAEGDVVIGIEELDQMFSDMKIGTAVVDHSHHHHHHEDDHEEGHDHDEHHDDEDEDGESMRRVFEVEVVDGNARRRRDVHEGMEGIEFHTTCYSKEQLLSIAGLDYHEERGLSKTGLVTLSPVMLQQVLSNACADKGENEAHSHRGDYSVQNRYLYASAAQAVLSFVPFLGLLIFQNVHSKAFKLGIHFFIALGIGSLSGDAVLHLIPEVLGIHSHGHDASHDHSEENDELDQLHHLAVILAGFYLFFIFDNFARLCKRWRSANPSDSSSVQDESVGDTIDTEIQMDNLEVISNENANGNHVNDKQANGSTVQETSSNSEQSSSRNISKKTSSSAPRFTLCFGMTPLCVMVLLGDIMHRFGDGIAMGAAFSYHWTGGIGTAIALFFHELPMEIGDFAIYIKEGLPRWKALLLNFLAALTAFGGLYIGLVLGENEVARRWLLAVVAGCFIYTSLVAVFRSMADDVTWSPGWQFILQNIGLLSGWAILFLISMYEHELHNLLEGTV